MCADYGNKGVVGRKGSAYERPKPTPLLPELEDVSMLLPFARGGRIDRALDQYAPHPVRFRRVWQVQIGSELASFYAWEPVPPGDGDGRYIALGMVRSLMALTTQSLPDDASLNVSW